MVGMIEPWGRLIDAIAIMLQALNEAWRCERAWRVTLGVATGARAAKAMA